MRCKNSVNTSVTKVHTEPLLPLHGDKNYIHFKDIHFKDFIFHRGLLGVTLSKITVLVTLYNVGCGTLEFSS